MKRQKKVARLMGGRWIICLKKTRPRLLQFVFASSDHHHNMWNGWQWGIDNEKYQFSLNWMHPGESEQMTGIDWGWGVGNRQKLLSIPLRLFLNAIPLSIYPSHRHSRLFIPGQWLECFHSQLFAKWNGICTWKTKQKIDFQCLLLSLLLLRKPFCHF